jgi:hypothetical protein
MHMGREKFMSESEKESNDGKTDGKEVEKSLTEYEMAQEVGLHADTVIHEVTAIVWGANTLLLGFILEVPCESNNQKLVIAASIVGIIMSVYVPWVHHLTKMGQRVAYEVCRKIESSLSLPHQLNTSIHEKYARWKPWLVAVWVLTVSFVVAWFYVIHQAWGCLCRCR